MTRVSRISLAALAALAAAAAPLAAQTGNQTDVTGPILTGSGPSGGSFLGAGLRSENEMFGRVGNQVVFRNARIGCAVRGAANAWRDSVQALQRSPAEQRVLDLVTASEGSPALASLGPSITAALTHGGDAGSPFGLAARRLADAMGGLLRNRGGCTQSRQDYGEAPQWQEAIEAFKAFVHDAPDSAFTPPAPELIAIHAALQSVVANALSRADAR